MNLSAKVEYAAVAVLELASHFEQRDPVRLRDISNRHGIPAPFLVQIMLQLKAAGLVESTRGSAGGYRLTRDPSSISLSELRSIIEGPGEFVSNLNASTPFSRALRDVWREVHEMERERLAEVTFASLLDRSRGARETMYYI
ncbi:MAG: Rrf2 family transcriptional regulator [Pirellulaceae bacterium]